MRQVSCTLSQQHLHELVLYASEEAVTNAGRGLTLLRSSGLAMMSSSLFALSFPTASRRCFHIGTGLLVSDSAAAIVFLQAVSSSVQAGAVISALGEACVRPLAADELVQVMLRVLWLTELLMSSVLGIALMLRAREAVGAGKCSWSW